MPVQVRSQEERENRHHHQLPNWLLRMLCGCLELVKFMDFVLMLLKVLASHPANVDVYGVVCLPVLLAAFLMLQRIYDAVALCIYASGVPRSQLIHTLKTTTPVSVWFFPLFFLAFVTYQKEDARAKVDERSIFAHRRFSGLLLALPLASVFFPFIADDDLVLHPFLVHLRVIQTISMLFIEIMPSLLLDVIMIVTKADVPGVGWFWVSLMFQGAEAVLFAFLSVKYVHDAEKRKPAHTKPVPKRPPFFNFLQHHSGHHGHHGHHMPHPF